jgi:hypothetical protein
MKSSISEFSFGFAITDEIVRQQRGYLTAAPSFPSLRDEGGRDGGYDLRLDRVGVPLFLQFKLLHRMVRGTCNEAVRGDFTPPFFRLKLMPLKMSLQHDMLLALDDGTNEVYYAAPLFTNQNELNRNYLANSVLNNSILIRPTTIGSLPDRNEHHLAFDINANRGRLYSKEGSEIKGILNAKQQQEKFALIVKQNGARLDHLLPLLYEKMDSIISQKGRFEKRILNKASNENSPLSATVNMARYFLGCELLFILQPEISEVE